MNGEAKAISCLCSGRDVHSLMHEVNNQELTYDFVICNNGGTILIRI